MTEPVPHYCTGCGELHGGERRENPEVAIARINREADVRIAELQASTVRDVTETETEAAVTVAESEAVQEAEVATAQAEAVVDVLTPEPEPEPEPVVVVDPAPEPDAARDGEPPEIEPVVPAPKAKSNPWW